MDRDITGLGMDGQGGPFQNLLSASADGNESAFSRTLCLKIIGFQFPSENAGQIVLQCDPLMGQIKQPGRKSRVSAGNTDAHFGRGGKGISLYMVNMQGIAAEPVAPSGVFIGRIAFMVDAL